MQHFPREKQKKRNYLYYQKSRKQTYTNNESKENQNKSIETYHIFGVSESGRSGD